VDPTGHVWVRIVIKDGKYILKSGKKIGKKILKKAKAIGKKGSKGKARAPKTKRAGSTYTQVNNKGEVVSQTKYGIWRKPSYRIDYGHRHFDKASRKYLQPHRHEFSYNRKGQCISKRVKPVK
jgi:hypothetical protein